MKNSHLLDIIVTASCLLLITACTPQSQPPSSLVSPLSSPAIPLSTSPHTPSPSKEQLRGKLVFSQEIKVDKNVTYEIGIMELNTRKIKMLTTSPAPGDAEPRWAPDGQTIYFTSGRSSQEGYGIYKMNVDGSNQTPIIKVEGKNTINSRSAVSPDGKRILFQSNRDGNLDIYIANIDGSNLRNLTNNPANDATASWSPDGSTIIFASDRTRSEYQLFTMNSDGSNVRPFIDTPNSINYSPKYSPDGKKIAYLTQSTSGGNAQISIINVDGSDASVITNRFDVCDRVGWIDNSTIVYASRPSDTASWSILTLDLKTKIGSTLLSGKETFTDPDWISN